MKAALVGENEAQRAPGSSRPGARRRVTFVLLAALSVAGLLVSLGWGAVSIGPDQIVGVLLDRAGIESGIDVLHDVPAPGRKPERDRDELAPRRLPKLHSHQ